ncbi:MAG TPA: amino acid adenylation domain-containing protein, partial [Thermoanaerobaculia bacterium]|nr:amino acid adenylation domain-containing protein [Thermoanaerobaculia bacterium]
EVWARANAEARWRFDLAVGPLVRLSLLRLGEEEHALLLNVHHIVSDAWSMGVLIQDLAALYEGSTRLPDLPVQYADFAIWQRERLRGEALEDQIAWWREKLAGAPAVLDLPTDRPRPVVHSQRGGTVGVRIPAEVAAGLRGAGRRAGATPFMALLSGFQILLARYTGKADAPVGSPIAGRTRSELEGLIGFFVNTLVLRTDLSGDPTFSETLTRARETTLGAFGHQDLPFERLVEELAPRRDLSYSPLFQVMLVLQNAPQRAIELPGLLIEPLRAQTGTAKFDLTLSLAETTEGLGGWLEYDLDLFDPATAERIAGHFGTLLAGAAADPGCRLSELPLLTAAEREQFLVDWNATGREVPAACVHEGIAEQAVRTPEAVAVTFGEASLTYRDLDRRANALAHRLRAQGVGPETRVGIALERSLEMVIGVLAVLKAGGAYVPLDPSYPAERLAFMREDSGLALVLEGDLGEIGESELPPAGGAGPSNLAYVIYTSGSTGRPKGVQIPHAALSNFLASMAERPGLGSGDVLLSVTSLSFDIAGLELYLPLLAGGRIVLASREEAADGHALRELIAASGATVMQATPATWRLLLEAGWEGGEGLVALCGGEALPPSLAASLRARTRALWNVYGPTETTVWSTAEEVGEGPITIGRPIANTAVYVMDAWGQPSPAGVPGELLIGGAGLARGYLERPELTAERFVPDPSGEGTRLYRTGDLARFRADGRLDHLGRLDHQVKVRGFRVELGEIEAELGRHPEVTAAVVVAREDRLVAYVVGDAPAEALRESLKSRLPAYMVPSAFVFLEALPLTPNGKVDRKALPEPGAGTAELLAGPLTPAEELLAGIWCDVLGLERVGVHQDFFELGGHSLIATRVASRVRDVFGVEMHLRWLFETPTVSGLAARLGEARLDEVVRPPLRPVSREGALPLSFAQERLWFLDRLEPGSAAYNMSAALRLDGVLDISALARTLDEIARRHEVLRTTFAEDARGPAQVIHPAGPAGLEVRDLSGLPEDEREGETRRLAIEDQRRPFDLAAGPLLRACLLRLADEEHVLLFSVHHIVSDGWSMGVLVREVGALYRAFRAGEPSPLPELPVQYADYAHWQRSWLQGEPLAERVAWWRGRL